MLKNIPTNIITGALGVGKTTLIQSLLTHKPKEERWAVLVNEFGEVGIDGSMLLASGKVGINTGIFIKEVPGGCMCCASGLPMQIALNLLLAQAKPHRLLIEPTGLGHPKEVLQTLTQPHYQDVLDVQATLTLIDIRKLKSAKWRNHITFRDQMQIADTVVVTKSDLYSPNYIDDLCDFMAELGITSTPIAIALHGKINSQLLYNKTSYKQAVESKCEAFNHHNTFKSPTTLIAPEQGVLKVVNQGEGYYSRGWLCPATREFNYSHCLKLFKTLSLERLKAVVIADDGVYGFNIADGSFTETRLERAQDTRIELISDNEKTADYLANLIETTLCLND